MAARARIIPSPQGNNQPNPAAARRSPRPRRRREVECMTIKELRKFSMFQKVADFYKDVRQSSSLTRSVMDTVEATSHAICQKVIKTRTGKTADKILARVTRKVHQTLEVEGKVQGLVVMMLQMAFRYWPPTLFARWGVDASLGASSATLALMKDLYILQNQPEEEHPQVDIDVVYSQYVPSGDDGSPTKSSPKKDIDSSGQAQGEEGEVEESVMEERAVLSVDESLELTEDESGYLNCEPTFCESILNRIVGVINTAIRLMFWVWLPLITVVTLLLCRVSNQLHSWAGMTELESPEERKERRELFALLVEDVDESIKKMRDDDGIVTDGNGHDGDEPVENEPDDNAQEEPEVLGRPEVTWMFDAVLDRQVATLQKYTIIGQLLERVGIQRPVKVAEMTAEKLKELKIKQESLVKYLEEDVDYNEEDDPDYQPNEDDAPEDSLEYREDEEMEPEIEVGEVGQ